MKRFIFTIIITLILVAESHADIIVIVNNGNSVESLSKKEVIEIYTGRVRTFQNGIRVQPIDQKDESKTRESFYKILTGKSLSQINAYWARLLFAGRHEPPIDDFDNQNAIIDAVKKNESAIAYVPDSVDTSAVKIVYRIEF